MPAAIHMAEVSKIPGAMSRSDLRPAGRNLCERTSASRSTKLAIAKRPTVIRRLSGSRAGRDMADRSSRLRRLASLPGRPARLAQQVEWALDGRDHAGGHARVARCRVELVVTEESLNDA